MHHFPWLCFLSVGNKCSLCQIMNWFFIWLQWQLPTLTQIDSLCPAMLLWFEIKTNCHVFLLITTEIPKTSYSCFINWSDALLKCISMNKPLHWLLSLTGQIQNLFWLNSYKKLKSSWARVSQCSRKNNFLLFSCFRHPGYFMEISQLSLFSLLLSHYNKALSLSPTTSSISLSSSSCHDTELTRWLILPKFSHSSVGTASFWSKLPGGAAPQTVALKLQR